MKKSYKKKPGISVLITIIIVSAVVVLLAITSTLTAIDQTKTGFHQNKSLQTFAGADGCIEEALAKLNSNHAYMGETLILGNISCTITVSGAGTTRTVNVVAINDGTYTREIQVDVDISSVLQIITWQELTT